MKIDKVEMISNDEKTPLKAIVDGVECWIPRNAENRHYKEIQKQISENKLQIIQPSKEVTDV